MQAVVATYGTMGDIRPLLALSAELLQRGHGIVFAAPPNFGGRVRQMGMDFVPLGPPVDIAVFREVYGRAYLNSDPVEHVRRTLPLAIRDAPRMIGELAACKGADVLLSLPYQLAGAIVHVLLNLPLISVHLSPFGGLSRRFAVETARPINELRAAYGLNPISDPLGPSGSSAFLTLVAVSPSLFPPSRRWPEYCHSTGFFFLDEEWTPDERLADFVASGEPPFVVSFGSMAHSNPDGVARLVREAVRQAGRRAVVQRGWSNLELDSSSDDLYVADFIPHGWLFPRSACVVHAGGAGTTAATLRAGVPSVVVPHMLDQYLWASLLKDQGCSPDAIPFPELSASRLASAVNGALASDCRKSAERMRDLLSHENGVAAAADLIESRMASGAAVAPDHAVSARRGAK